MHGQLLTESIRFKVTLEVNVTRADKELGSEVLRFRLMERIKWMQRQEMESKVVKNYAKSQIFRFNEVMSIPPDLCFA
jgi:hypothetical protein